MDTSKGESLQQAKENLEAAEKGLRTMENGLNKFDLDTIFPNVDHTPMLDIKHTANMRKLNSAGITLVKLTNKGKVPDEKTKEALAYQPVRKDYKDIALYLKHKSDVSSGMEKLRKNLSSISPFAKAVEEFAKSFPGRPFASIHPNDEMKKAITQLISKYPQFNSVPHQYSKEYFFDATGQIMQEKANYLANTQGKMNELREKIGNPVDSAEIDKTPDEIRASLMDELRSLDPTTIETELKATTMGRTNLEGESNLELATKAETTAETTEAINPSETMLEAQHLTIDELKVYLENKQLESLETLEKKYEEVLTSMSAETIFSEIMGVDKTTNPTLAVKSEHFNQMNKLKSALILLSDNKPLNEENMKALTHMPKPEDYPRYSLYVKHKSEVNAELREFLSEKRKDSEPSDKLMSLLKENGRSIEPDFEDKISAFIDSKMQAFSEEFHQTIGDEAKRCHLDAIPSIKNPEKLDTGALHQALINEVTKNNLLVITSLAFEGGLDRFKTAVRASNKVKKLGMMDVKQIGITKELEELGMEVKGKMSKVDFYTNKVQNLLYNKVARSDLLKEMVLNKLKQEEFVEKEAELAQKQGTPRLDFNGLVAKRAREYIEKGKEMDRINISGSSYGTPSTRSRIAKDLIAAHTKVLGEEKAKIITFEAAEF